MKRGSHTGGGPARLVMWAGSFEAAGTQRFLLEFLRRVDRSKLEPVLFSTAVRGELLPEIRSLGVAVHEFGTGRHVWSPRTVTDLTRAAAFLRREQTDILDCMLGITTLVGPFVGRAAGVPVVVNNQRNLSYWLSGGVKERVYGFVSRRLVDAVLVNSEAAIRELVERFAVPESKIMHVGVGTDLSRAAEAAPNEALVSELGLGGRRVVGIVGKLSQVKGHRLFLKAAALISQTRADVAFLVVGDGPDREALEAESEALGLSSRVRFAGARGDVPSLLKTMDVLVVSSFSEGSPNVVLEGMGAGVPLVATRVGGIPEIVEDGRSGLLVEPGDARALSEAVLALLNEPERARSMGRRGRELAVERFDIDAVVRRTEDVLLGLLERARSGAGGRA